MLKNINIEQEDVWTRVFVQSLDGHARKWFKELTTGSVAGIESLDDVLLGREERPPLLYHRIQQPEKRKWGVCLQLYQEIQQYVHQDPYQN